jgi:hypothetical protein
MNGILVPVAFLLSADVYNVALDKSSLYTQLYASVHSNSSKKSVYGIGSNFLYTEAASNAVVRKLPRYIEAMFSVGRGWKDFKRDSSITGFLCSHLCGMSECESDVKESSVGRFLVNTGFL